MHVSATWALWKTFRAARSAIPIFIIILVFCAGALDATPAQAGSPSGAGDVTTILPLTYALVAGPNVPVYASPDDAGANIPPLATLGVGFVWVSLSDSYPVYAHDAVWYKVSPAGYIRADQIKIQPASNFQGTMLASQPDKPFGWVVYPVRASSAPGAAPAREAPLLPRYTPITILGQQRIGNWTWYRIGENQWLEQRQVGIVSVSPRPDGIAATEKWIEVNLFEQTLAAYEGDRMVYATLVSSGLPQWPTPTGLFRIWVKATFSKMSGRDGLPDYYFLQDVPWSMYFDHDVALHGAYWHDRFGAPHSHGCVNLAPEDALWLFDWTTPSPGLQTWTLPSADSPGTWVWVH